jgi:hypothetical protein
MADPNEPGAAAGCTLLIVIAIFAVLGVWKTMELITLVVRSVHG